MIMLELFVYGVFFCFFVPVKSANTPLWPPKKPSTLEWGTLFFNDVGITFSALYSEENVVHNYWTTFIF